MGFVDLDHTAADLAYFVDLLATLANDGTNHIVGNVDLLGERCAGHGSTGNWLPMGADVRLRTSMAPMLLRGHVRTGATVASGSGRMAAVGNSRSGAGVSLVRMTIPLGWVLLVGRHVVGAGVGTAAGVVVAVSIVPSGRLRGVGDNLQAAWHGASGSTATGGVGRRSRSAETIVELLKQGAAYIVGGNVDGIGDAHDNERAFTRQREACVRSVETSTRRLLNLLDARTTLAYDGSNEDMRNQEAEGVGLGVSVGGFLQRLIVEGSDDQPKGL